MFDGTLVKLIKFPAEHLTIFHGTLVFRGTPIENHWPKGQSMDARNTRSRKAIETLSQANNEPTLKDLHAMLLSVIQRLDSIENDLLKRMTAFEGSVENAHYRVSELEH